jgi:sugar lactone lactonase YvrE
VAGVGAVWAADEDGRVWRVDAAAPDVSEKLDLDRGRKVLALDAGGSTLFVADAVAGRLYVVDTAADGPDPGRDLDLTDAFG